MIKKDDNEVDIFTPITVSSHYSTIRSRPTAVNNEISRAFRAPSMFDLDANKSFSYLEYEVIRQAVTNRPEHPPIPPKRMENDCLLSYVAP